MPIVLAQTCIYLEKAWRIEHFDPASPVCRDNAYLKSCSKWKRKEGVLQEITRSNLKYPPIAIMPDGSWLTVSFPIPLIFRYHLPLKEGGREAGKCSKVVPDRGDRCLFIFLWSRLFCNVFPFTVCKAQLIGNWYENRRSAPNTIIFLIIRQYDWCTDAPCTNSNGRPNTKKIRETLLAHHAWSGLPIGGGGHRCTNILAHWSTLRQ